MRVKSDFVNSNNSIVPKKHIYPDIRIIRISELSENYPDERIMHADRRYYFGINKK